MGNSCALASIVELMVSEWSLYAGHKTIDKFSGNQIFNHSLWPHIWPFFDLKVVCQHMAVLPPFLVVSQFKNHTPAWKLPTLVGFQILAKFPTILQHLYSINLPTIT